MCFEFEKGAIFDKIILKEKLSIEENLIKMQFKIKISSILTDYFN